MGEVDETLHDVVYVRNVSDEPVGEAMALVVDGACGLAVESMHNSDDFEIEK